MRKRKRHEFRQAYNAQAVVDAGGSQLIVGARISTCASDRNELVADIEAIAAALGRPETVPADNGYANGAAVAALEASGIEALVATAAQRRRRRHDFRPAGAGTAAKEAKADWLREMATKLDSEEGRALYRLRRQTVEPVFGVIKAVLGFTGFSLRGLDKVAGEWNLVALAYNCKRLHKLTLATASCRRPWPDFSMRMGRHSPASAGIRRSSDRPQPILAVSSSIDCAAGRRKPNHSQSESDPKVRQTANPAFSPRSWFVRRCARRCGVVPPNMAQEYDGARREHRTARWNS